MRAVGWLGLLAGVGGCLCLVELLGERLVLGSCGVEVGFGSFGADAERGSCFFECGDAGVGGGAVLVALAAGVGSDEGDFLGGLGLGAVGALLGGGLGLLRACGFPLGLACPAGGVGGLALSMLAGLADLAFRGGPCEFEFGGRLGAELAELLGGAVAEGGEFVLEFFHAGDGLGGGVVGLVAVGAGLVAFGLGFAAAGDLLGEAGLGGGDALVGGGAGGVDLGFGGFGVGGGAQLGDGAGEAALLWRVKADLRLPPLEFFPDGSYRSALVSPKITGKARQKLIDAARAGEDLDEDKARYVRVIEYEVPDRECDGKDELN